ncbi:MAG: bis(5'-nucleosyl)-tetraphosphatase (symmetrical) YqeK, partial [Pygmaiobacter sp.]
AEKRPVGIWHAAAAMVYAKESLGIEDKEILNAIRYHTSGRAEMSLLEKIIYMADMCSEERDYSEVGELRALLRSDLDKALIKALSYSIRWLKEDQRDIDEDSIAALHFMSERYSARG